MLKILFEYCCGAKCDQAAGKMQKREMVFGLHTPANEQAAKAMYLEATALPPNYELVSKLGEVACKNLLQWSK
jgi:hypothetical protein